MSDSPVVTLTTDFGVKDPFVGEMKGVILTINRSAVIVDITHDITSYDISEGALVIGESHRYFPPGSIHVAVVDPGVGSARRPIVVEAGGHYFVGPDNGLFSLPLSRCSGAKIFQIAEERFLLRKESPTFQGRDIFAPAAAWLSRGKKPEAFGPPVTDPVVLSFPEPIIEGDSITGEVAVIDKFGNCITTIRGDDLRRFGKAFRVEVNETSVAPVGHYAEAAEGRLSCLINSSDRLELFVKNGSAARLFNIDKQTKVIVRSFDNAASRGL